MGFVAGDEGTQLCVQPFTLPGLGVRWNSAKSEMGTELQQYVPWPKGHGVEGVRHQLCDDLSGLSAVEI
ncbi:hypothetical protein NL676_023822 [Syzygium grande]|nr:hypothetical protein NL676_023822 [Syzygium grande]